MKFTEICHASLWDLLVNGIELEDVQKCEGKSCSWCGRFNKIPRPDKRPKDVKIEGE